MMKSPFRKLTLAAAGSCLIAVSVPLAAAQAVNAPSAQVPAKAAAVPNSAAVSTAAEQKMKIAAKLVEEHSELLDAKLSIPVISGMADAAYQDKLNSSIEKQAMEVLDSLKQAAAEDKAAAGKDGYEFHKYDMELSYAMKSDGGKQAGGILSFEVLTYTYFGGAHGMTLADTYNVVTGTAATALTLEKALGEGGLAKADRAVRYAIQHEPERFYPDALATFAGVAENHPFYIENGVVNLVFQQYELAPYAGGIIDIPVTKASAAGPSVTLGKTQIAAGPSGAKLVPLRITAEKLGYKVAWNNKTQRAELSRGAQRTSVAVGKNSYAVNKIAPIKLSAPPAVVKGSLYVPVEFYSSILKLTVTANANNGSISISG